MESAHPDDPVGAAGVCWTCVAAFAIRRCRERWTTKEFEVAAPVDPSQLSVGGDGKRFVRCDQRDPAVERDASR